MNTASRPRYARISRDVADLISKYKIQKAPVDVETLATKCGAQVVFNNFEKAISGLVFRQAGKFIIGVANEQHPNRQRFTIAHELGHVLLHDFSEVHIDRSFGVMFRSPESSAAKDVFEVEANAFAAELLMPEAFLIKDLENFYIDIEDGTSVQELAESYGVSSQAMTYRLQNLMARHRISL